MNFTELPPRALKKIRRMRYDRLVEKHEGPFDWDSELDLGDLEFLQVHDRLVLLPVPKANLPNITVFRCIIGDEGRSLTLFLKDTTHVRDPRDELWQAGFVAVCDQVKGEDFFVAILYHEWFIIRNK